MQARLLSSVYDSAKIGDFVSAIASDERFNVVLGRLRLDALLYDRVVLVDADLTDGTFFLAAAHRGRLSDIPWDRIELKNRAESLEQSFLGQFKRAGSDWMVPFTFSSMPQMQAVGLAESLNRLPSKNVTDLKTLAAALSDAGLSTATASWYLYAWKEMCDKVPILARANTSLWKTNGFSVEQQLAITRDAVRTALKTGHGQGTFEVVLANWRSRNDVARVLASVGRALSFEEQSDFATMRTWYTHGYKAAQANQHSCNAIETFPEEHCRNFAPSFLPLDGVPSRAGVGCEVPRYFLRALGKMSAADFSRTSEGERLRHCVAVWREGRDEDALAEVVGLVVGNLNDSDLTEHLRLEGSAKNLELPASVVTAVTVDQCLKALSRRKFIHLTGGEIAVVAGLAGYKVEKVTEMAISQFLGVKEGVSRSVVQMENRRMVL